MPAMPPTIAVPPLSAVRLVILLIRIPPLVDVGVISCRRFYAGFFQFCASARARYAVGVRLDAGRDFNACSRATDASAAAPDVADSARRHFPLPPSYPTARRMLVL